MSTSSNTKALLQTLLWRQQGNIGGRLGKLVIYIHNVMRPIQIFASHVITLMWGFLEPKKNVIFTWNVTFLFWIDILLWQNVRWKVEVQIFLSQLMMSNRVRETFEKVWNTCFYLLFLLKFSNFLVGKPPFLQTCVIIHLSWVFFLSEWDEIRKSTLGFSFCRDLTISRVYSFQVRRAVKKLFV